MIEVFKTNVNSEEDADLLLLQIHVCLPACKANFDLEDRDSILRIKSVNAADYDFVIKILESNGFEAEILTDEPVLK
jgi:hypothetical protein